MVSPSHLEHAVEKYGEVFVVLESDREYEIHGKEGYELQDGIIRIEGLHDDEYLVVEFSVDTIEHIYTHKEV